MTWSEHRYSIPVDVRALARELGVEVLSTEAAPRAPNYAVALDRREAGVVRIWLRHTDDEVHQRFSLAHALGHMLLHSHLHALHRDVTFQGSACEADANLFAAHLLMPSRALAARIRTHKGDVVALADTFQVSHAAMRYRLALEGL